jgi:hypothetical protein
MIRAVAAWFVVLAACASAGAGEGPAVAPLRDPWVPPAVRAQPHRNPETRGDDLRRQVEGKLRESFEAADTERRGSITREQARAANLGIVADNFDAIDPSRSGRVTFDDFRKFLRSRGARNL